MAKGKKGIPYRDALKDIQKGKIALQYFFFGDELFLAEQLKQKIILKTLGTDKDDFNLHTFYGKDIQLESLINAITSFPVMAERKVVILKEADLLKKDERESLTHYIEKPDDATCLIVIADKPDFRLKLFSMLEKHAVTVQFDKLNESDMPDMIRNLLKEHGKQISDSAAFIMASRLNLSLQELDAEIGKLVSYMGERGTISEEDIETVTGISRQYNVFELCQRIGNKDFAGAVTVLRQLILRGEEPAGMIALIFRQYNILWQIAECQTQRYSSSDIERSMRDHFNLWSNTIISEYTRQAGQFDLSHLRQSFEFILQADRDIKSISVKPAVIMEKLIYLLIYGMPR